MNQHRNRAAQALVADLARHGIKVPKPVKDRADHLARLGRRLGTTPRPGDHRADAVAALLADPAADIAAHVAAEVDAHVLTNALAKARNASAALLADAVTEHHAAIVAAVRSTLFEPAVATLERVANSTSADDTPTSLLRAGRSEDATALSSAPLAGENLALALELRMRLYRGVRSGLGSMRCAVWQNPGDIAPGTLHDLTGTDRWLAGIRAGGRLWFATLPEVEDAERALRQAEKAAEAEAAQALAASHKRQTVNGTVTGVR